MHKTWNHGIHRIHGNQIPIPCIRCIPWFNILEVPHA